jgi:hypothetical protein
LIFFERLFLSFLRSFQRGRFWVKARIFCEKEPFSSFASKIKSRVSKEKAHFVEK